MLRHGSRHPVVVLVVLAWVALAGPEASALASWDFATPVFGLAVRGGVVFVADAGKGVVRLDTDDARLVTRLRGVSDVAPIRRGRMWALTTTLYQVVSGTPRPVADIARFEEDVNPDQGVVESNPFDLARLARGQVLVADAAANALLIADRLGSVDWVATLPPEEVSTANAKQLAGCPDPPPDLAEICDLPDMMPAEAVPTTVAVGPDGAYYVGELKGFPAPLGESRVWRIEPGTLHADCASDAACSVVADGFTSIVDMDFGPDGTLHVVELDEASFFAVELQAGQGGTIDACDSTTWTCTEEATDLPIPMAVAVTASGVGYAVVSALVPNQAEVIELS